MSRGRKPSLTADEKTLKTIEALAKIQCTQAEAAAVLGCHRGTFINFLDGNSDARLLWDNGLEAGRASLRRNQFRLAEKNAAMAIWLGKQYLGQRDPSHEYFSKKEQQAAAAATAGRGSEWASDLEFEAVTQPN